ncbi:MAG: helix-turn-helix transcriptional regulator [Chloroflexi bacterium]|uniref:Helix-turn-helix domain-containing protein n=1 Tax=Candidatus Chlorohelix allophototropha TaxID=3003348 RepID=A0A8T7LWX9_9CHLR|nr:helix-turn-helix transcriptional regulator [Chloroflexota bacterium]WJW65866.1 helix-turn-helix domain-containing protein [Chloroflexota bacterium L227-S17]
MNSPTSAIGLRLRLKRAKTNMTIEQLSLLAGVNKGTISGIETGKRSPQNRTLMKLAKALKVEIEELLNE